MAPGLEQLESRVAQLLVLLMGVEVRMQLVEEPVPEKVRIRKSPLEFLLVVE